MLHHVQDIGFCGIDLGTGKNRISGRKTGKPQIFFCIMTADANPEITPGIYVICLIKCQFARMNEKPLSLFEQIALLTGIEHPFSFQAEMKQVAVPDCRSEGIGGSTVLHPAKDRVNV